MADAAVSFVVERLEGLLKQKAISLRNVSKNVEGLKTELTYMQDFLEEADARPHPDNRVKQNLVAEIRELAHDAEDIIESHVLATESASKECCLTVAALRIYNSWNVASEIDGFTSKINELTRRLQTYGSTRAAGDRSGTHQPRRTFSHLAEQHGVIGLENDAETISTKLIDGTLRSRAVSICGMGGIGKTTLAKMIYRNTEVGSHFNNRLAWGCVSRQHKERDIWQNILTKFTSPDENQRELFSKLTEQQMAKELYQLLEKEKCLVVLDDIWTKEAWDCLSAGFPEANNTESKILLTTRNEDVASHVDPDCFILRPGFLNESQSWELFHSVAIRPREEVGITDDVNLEELGRTIVKRCGGLPLAIITIGGILRTKSSIADWNTVWDNLVLHLRGTNNGPDELQIMNLLALSYHDLQYQSKQCFLHFSHFPEDFIIPATTIIKIWVAEGIFKGGKVEEPEDIAYKYLKDLVSRCMIQVVEQSSTGRIKSCRLHDLMRDLCIQEAQKEKFVHVKYLENGNHVEATIQSTLVGKFRHLSLHMENSNQGPHLNYHTYDHRIWSLLVFYNDMDQAFLNKSLLAMIKHFKNLKILYLDGNKVELEIPKEIGYLVRLRLLDMGSSRAKHLPPSLGKLTKLLTLKLDHLLIENHIPNIFENMHHLRHLYLPASAKFSFKNMNLSHLKNLQTLVNLPLKYVRIEDLVGLSSLRKLKLKVSDDDEFKRLVEMFNKSPNTTFKKLQYLSVKLNSEEVIFEIAKVAATFSHLHKLKFSGPLVLDLLEISQIFRRLNKLKLKSSNFVEDPMPHLGKLPSLRVLHLKSALGIDKIMLPKDSFPALQSLVLKCDKHLTEWIIEEGALPYLGFLQLYFCANLKTLPEGLEFVHSLQELQIGAMPKEFRERIMDSQIVKIVRLRWDDDYLPYIYDTQIFSDENPNACTIV